MEILVWFSIGIGVIALVLAGVSLLVIRRLERDMMELLGELMEEEEEYPEIEMHEHEVFIN